MDPHPRGFSDSINGLKFNDENLLNAFNFEQSFLDQNIMDLPFFPPDPNLNSLASSSSVNPEEDSPEDCDFSDIILKYISQMLMEEMEEESCMFQESSVLQAAEKPFYEILGEKYPPSSDPLPLYVDDNAESPVDNFNGNYSNYNSSSSTSSSNTIVDTSLISDLDEYKSSHIQSLPVKYTSQSSSQLSFSSSNSINNIVEGLVESPVSMVHIPDFFSESQPVWQFRRGVEEASKFLPNSNNLTLHRENNGLFAQEPKKEAGEIVIEVEKKGDREHSSNGSTRKKNLHHEDLEGRSNKQSAVFAEETERSNMFDMVLLHNEKCASDVSKLREAVQTEASKNAQQNDRLKGSKGRKSRGKKQGGKREVVDLRTLLVLCAQAVAIDDRRSANELLKQIRQHSSPFGDGTQRLAHCFADGLEARLAGTGSQIYTSFITKRISAADFLKAYQLFCAACPFKKLANFFSNQMIMTVADNAKRLHIIDFGIYYGFQWPSFIQRLSASPVGPPRLRITGIDLPQPGFRPAQRVEETGRRLVNYAKSFNVPFEYNGIAQKLETIQIEDLKIDRDEVLVVNCSFQFKSLLDETVVVDSPRNAVLNLIRKMNPDIFIHGIVSGAYGAPFFITRFREALFHYSALFDLLETNVPREDPERLLIEREFIRRESLNVIACEGSERVERPETYKQWQVRSLRAGFMQLPLNKEIVKKARDWVKLNYHKDFVVDEDSQWMLQGWKGRIVYAHSAWRPVYES